MAEKDNNQDHNPDNGNPRNKWAQGKKPSMKRRCEEQNYTERGFTW